MKHRIALLIPALLMSGGVAQAAERTTKLNVHHAYCELCPSIVTKALQHVSGVKAVVVTKPDPAGDMAATVTFDDAVATVPQLVAAATNAGYPTEAPEQ